MITTRFKRIVCMVLCLCMILQVIPLIASATEVGPVILRQPEDAAAALNEKFSVSVEAEGEGLTYQWYIKNRGSAKFSKSSIKSATYSTTMTKARAGREIYCVITDINGNSVVTNVVTLTGVSSIPLEITRQPVSTSAHPGEAISISLEAQGEGLKYQWYLRNKGSDTFSKSSIKSDTYTTTMTAARAGRDIYCVITDALGNTVTSDIVTLIGEVRIPLEITRQPVSQTAHYGDEVSVSLEAQGEGLKYQWYLRNKGSKSFSKSSIKSDTYTVTMNEKRDGREIYCVITDALGNTVISDTVTIGKTPERVMMFSPASTESAEAVTESVSESVTEPVSEPVTETVTEPVTETYTEPVTETETVPVTEPKTEMVTEPVSEPVTEPVRTTASPAKSNTAPEPVAEPENEIIDITEKLNALMLKNGEELRRIRKEKGYLYACLYYYIKVTDAGDWDIKRTDEWKFEKGKTYVYQGVEMRMDDPGNIHFGYLGAILFHEEFVCFGAGLNNFMKFGRRDGDFYSYFDDPHDQIMMRWGYRMYKEGF